MEMRLVYRVGKTRIVEARFRGMRVYGIQELRDWVKLLISSRKRYAALRRGDFTHLLSDDRRRCYAFSRRLGNENIVVVMNASSTKRNLRVPLDHTQPSEGRILHNLLGKGEYSISGKHISLSLPPKSGVWLV